MTGRPGLIAALVCSAALVGQGPAAGAAPDRLRIERTGTDAVVVEVPARNGNLLVGNRMRGTVYTWEHGDPPCDPTGTTVYAGHSWRGGEGVGDRWGRLRRGDRIEVGGCAFRVLRREHWSRHRTMSPLYAVGGPPRIVLVTCKPDDYSRRTVVFARLITR